jgi:subtilisin-like proprotein convertase family protein
MGWSQNINTDTFFTGGGTLPSGVTTTIANTQRIFGWTYSIMGYKDAPNQATYKALRVNPLIYTQSTGSPYTFWYNRPSIFGDFSDNYNQSHMLQKAIGFYNTTPKNFKRDKVYQFSTVIMNYLQIGESTTYAKQWRSPALYLVTPLGEKTELLADKTFYKDYRQNITGSSNTDYDFKKSDTFIIPWAYFESKASLDVLNAPSAPGRIFTFNYYSSPKQDVTSYLSQRPSTFYSNILFGNSHTSTTYNSLITASNFRNTEFKGNGNQTSGTHLNTGEGIVSYSINEIDWLIQGFSYVSMFTTQTTTALGNSYTQNTFSAKPWTDGGNLFGNGWYVAQNRYIWYDRPKSSTSYWQSEPLYKGLANDPYFNMPVGGPWSGGPDVDIPNWYDRYGFHPDDESDVIGQVEPNRSTETTNKGSGLNGYSKSPHEGFRKNNYIAKFVNYDKFNLSFKYRNARMDNIGIKFYLSSSLPSQRPISSYISSATPDKPILDWGTTTDTIFVPLDSNNFLTSATTLKEIKVTVNIEHTWDGDLILNLKGPAPNDFQGIGKTINLFNRERGNSDNLVATVFTSDDNKPSISKGSAPFTDTYKMKKDIGVGYNAYRSNTKDVRKLLNSAGTIVGNWTLYIKDDAGLDVGRLKNWKIEFVFDDNSSPNYVGTLTYSVTDREYTFYGLQGNQYLIFVGDPVPQVTGATYVISVLTDLKIEETYHVQNNTLLSVGTNSIANNSHLNSGLGLFDSYYYKETPSFFYNIGVGNTLNALRSLTYSTIKTKAGTGRFNSGIWEDGNWLNGYREDTTVRNFFSVSQFYSYNRDKKWRLTISGPSYNVSMFNVGDKISISNIVAIDINDERKLIRNYYTIINKTSTTLLVEFEYDFPLRRVEKDSPYHFICITKNIWLNGNFFNGYFNNGVWTNGSFYGLPYTTKMINSHWIDGELSGGHFKSSVISFTYSAGNIGMTNSVTGLRNRFVSITLDSTHSFSVGDEIYVSEFEDDSVESVMFGKTKVNRVINNRTIETSIFTSNSITFFLRSANFIGKVRSYKNTGLIQNMTFDSLNVSKSTAINNNDDRSVFSYNSWIDVVFDETSATNIFQPLTNYDELTDNNISNNNLYGYITYDVLSSVSKFRDSFSTSIRNYKLGTKHKIFSDYIGDSGKFSEYFRPNSNKFQNLGWKWSKSSSSGSFVTFSRNQTSDFIGFLFPIIAPVLKGKELKVSARYDGGVLNLQNPLEEVGNRDTDKLEPNRYTMIQFDLVDSDLVENNYVGRTSNYNPRPMELPTLHFSNLNVISKKIVYPTLNTIITNIVEASYLPVYKNINHILTPNKTKTEYFFNKRDLMMSFRGSGDGGKDISEFVIDNLSFYEVDMIPFFKYFTNENINRSVQAPLVSKRSYVRENLYAYRFIELTPKFDRIERSQYLSDTYDNIGLPGLSSELWVESSDITPFDIFYDPPPNVVIPAPPSGGGGGGGAIITDQWPEPPNSNTGDVWGGGDWSWVTEDEYSPRPPGGYAEYSAMPPSYIQSLYE